MKSSFSRRRSASRTKARGSPRAPRRDDLVLDPATSLRMAGVRQRDTSAEQLVRQILGRLGHRYRSKNRDLPGSPDIANRSRLWAVFVHGCFWHRHEGCVRTTTPKRNRLFWEEKFAQNQRRDARVQGALRKLGFTTIVIWECQVDSDEGFVSRRLARRIGPAPVQS
ncbi:MAG: very short patch repair endonuclease [Thermoanaerobaculia bacterium]